MQTIDTPAARATDPCTSHDAADAITASGHRARKRQQVYEALVQYGQEGVTSEELARLSGIDYGTVEKRLSELRGPFAVIRGYPESPERRRNLSTGRTAMVWRPVDTANEAGESK